MRRSMWLITLVLIVALAACGKKKDKDSGPTVTPSPGTPTATWTPNVPPAWTPTPPGFVPSETPTLSEASPSGTDGQGGGQDVSVTPPDEVSGPTLDPTDQAATADAGGGVFAPAAWTDTPTLTPTLTLTPSLTLTPTFTPTHTLTPTPLPPECYELSLVEREAVETVTDPEDVGVVTYAGYGVKIRWQPISKTADFPYYQVRVFVEEGDDIREVRSFQFSPLEYLIPGTNIVEFEIPGDVFESTTRTTVYGWEVWPIDINGERVCFSVSDEIIVKPGAPPTATPIPSPVPTSDVEVVG